MPSIRLLLWALLLCLLGLQSVQLIGVIINPSWIPYNGYFQNANPVERLCLGQWPGRDFDPYLGLGISWLAWPATLLFGCDPQTIDAVYQILTRVFFALTFAGMGWAAGLRKSDTLALFGGLMLGQAGLGGFLPLLGVSSLQILNPSTSLFGLRVSVPILLILLIAAVRSSLSHTLIWSAAGAATAIAALFAPDSGATALIGFAAFFLADHWLRYGLTTLRPFLTGILSAAIGCLIVLGAGALLLTGGYPNLWLHWLLFEMLPTQGWIFAYDPDAVAIAWLAPFTHPSSILLLPLTFLLARRPGSQPAALIGITTAALAAGWIPYISGMQNPRYLIIIDLTLITLAIATAIQLFPTERIRQIATVTLITVTVPIVILTITPAFAPWRAPSIPTPWGGRSHPSWQPLWDIGTDIQTTGGHLVSLYRGPLARAARAEPVGRQDYLIHAFHPDAIETWRQMITQARWVVTLAPEIITFGRWMERVYWPVLRETYTLQIPKQDIGPLRLWEARTKSLTPDGRPVPCQIDTEGLIHLYSHEISEPFLAEVFLEIPSLRRPMIIERSPVVPNHTPAGTYALPPKQTHHIIPADLVPKTETTLEIRQGSDRIRPVSCSATLFLPRATLAPDPGPTPTTPHTAYTSVTARPDGKMYHRITLISENPFARPPWPGERLDICPHLPIRYVQWIRENRVILVLQNDQTEMCLPEGTRLSVYLLPPENEQ